MLGMEESYETFEEELGPPRANPPPQKSVQQSSRAEMYAARKIREEMIPGPREPRVEPKTLARDPSLHTTASLSNQNLTLMETPWENVTLNRCLFVAITILVLTSGFHRLHETLRGQGTTEEVEEVGLRARRSGTLRHRGKLLQTETSLWEVMFWWLPDLDDDDDDDEEEEDDDNKEVKRGCPLKTTARRSSGLRNRPMLDKSLMKQKERKLKDKRTKKSKDEARVRKQGEKKEEPEEAAEDKDTKGDDQNDRAEDLKKGSNTEKEKTKI